MTTENITATSSAGALSTPTPAAVTPPAAAAATGTTPPPAANWFDGAQGEDLSWVQNKGFKSHVDLISSSRNLEKMVGVPQDRLLKLAEKMRDDKGSLTPEARQIYERLGAPKDPKEYEFEQGWEPEFQDLMRTKMFEKGISKQDAKELSKASIEYQKAFIEKQKAAMSNKVMDDDQALKRDWGSAYDQNINIAKQAAKAQGWDDAKINAVGAALGHSNMVKMLHQLGLSQTEGRFVSGTQNSAPRVLTPDEADTEMRGLMNDKEFVKSLSNGDKDALDRWTKLNQQKAASGEYRLNQDVRMNIWDKDPNRQAPRVR